MGYTVITHDSSKSLVIRNIYLISLNKSVRFKRYDANSQNFMTVVKQRFIE